tara:strand:- start:850 stop:1089 length:240 start_codon:yes stop_codon:yes gene_type:complete
VPLVALVVRGQQTVAVIFLMAQMVGQVAAVVVGAEVAEASQGVKIYSHILSRLASPSTHELFLVSAVLLTLARMQAQYR